MISDEIRDLAERGWPVSLEEWKELWMNSYEREFLYPYVTDETLKHIVTHCLAHCQRHSTAVYDGQLREVLVPELLRRLLER